MATGSCPLPSIVTQKRGFSSLTDSLTLIRPTFRGDQEDSGILSFHPRMGGGKHREP